MHFHYIFSRSYSISQYLGCCDLSSLKYIYLKSFLPFCYLPIYSSPNRIYKSLSYTYRRNLLEILDISSTLKNPKALTSLLINLHSCSLPRSAYFLLDRSNKPLLWPITITQILSLPYIKLPFINRNMPILNSSSKLNH